MTKRLTPYGSSEHANNLSKVGKGKTPQSLVARMPSPDVVAKVGGKSGTPASLAARMPTAEVAAKVGIPIGNAVNACRVVRRNARAAN